jgi:hypothetical protein
MPLILGTNSIKDTGYNVANSVRLDASYMKRTVTPSTSNTWTLSFWLKKSGHNGSSEGYLFSYGADGGQGFYITNAGYLGYYGAGGYSSDSTLSQGVLRDVSAWYHICFSVSSGTGTLYINGVQDATISNVAPLNATTGNTYAVNSYINYEANFDNFLGYMAEYVFIDGTAYNQNSFGEFDSDSPTIWKPIDVSGLTFGTNGFYLDFADSSDLGKDVSGNSNHFTTTGLTATDQSTDTCTNNFATMNPLAVPPSNAPTFAEGNTKVSTNNANGNPTLSTIGVSQGKWYVEAKRISYDGGSSADDGFRIGLGVTYDQNVNIIPAGISNSGHYFMIGSGIVYNGSTDLGDKAGDSNVSDDGVVGIALDLDNNRISWSFNGAYMTGSGAWSGSSPSSYVTIESGKTYFFLQNDGSTGRAYTAGWNFGGTSAFTISSGNSDANGYGNFEYAPPSGYYALCTKNLAEYG